MSRDLAQFPDLSDPSFETSMRLRFQRISFRATLVRYVISNQLGMNTACAIHLSNSHQISRVGNGIHSPGIVQVQESQYHGFNGECQKSEYQQTD